MAQPTAQMHFGEVPLKRDDRGNISPAITQNTGIPNAGIPMVCLSGVLAADALNDWLEISLLMFQI